MVMEQAQFCYYCTVVSTRDVLIGLFCAFLLTRPLSLIIIYAGRLHDILLLYFVNRG